MSKTMQTPTNGSNGHSINPDVKALLAQLTAALTPAAPAVAPVPPPKVRTKRMRKLDPEVAPLTAEGSIDPDHVCSVYTILEAVIPAPENTVSQRPGAGMIVRAACRCGRVCTMEIPAQDAEVMAQTCAWEGEEV